MNINSSAIVVELVCSWNIQPNSNEKLSTYDLKFCWMAKSKPQTFLIGSLLYVLLFAGANEDIGGADRDNKCGGEERWEEKVLVDKNASEINETPVDTTIAGIVAINTKTPETRYKEGRPRMEIEKKLYRVKHCFITDAIRENDNDIHLVIEDGDRKNPHTMIAEIPDPRCPDAKKSEWSGNFEEVRDLFLDHATNYRHFLFTVTGVLFVDKAHGQTGRAPNSVELHPITELTIERRINPHLQWTSIFEFLENSWLCWV